MRFARSFLPVLTKTIVGFLGLTLVLGVTSHAWALPGTSNLSLAGTATSSGSSYGSTEAAAIDGNRDGNFYNGSVWYGNHPASLPFFYEVDLGKNAFIERVQCLRRSDLMQGVFGNMRLTIYQDDGAGGHGTVAFTKDYYTDMRFTDGTWGTTEPGASAPGGAYGRFVRLERLDNQYWLTFAEFEVIGSPWPLTFTEANNLAAGKPVTTSSEPYTGCLASSGNDGNINADFYYPAGAQSVYGSSNHGVGEYWQVDLGAETRLDFLELFARSDQYTTTEFKVSVLDGSLAEVGSVIVPNSDPKSATPDYDHTIDVRGMTGRYIRVETTRDEYLAFTELRAFAITLFADVDGDGDVDQDDFAAFQLCFTGSSPATLPPPCARFDRDNDGDVDALDLTQFQNCATGPMIQWTAELTPNCVP